MTGSLIPIANTDMVARSGIDGMLTKIRPQWQAKSLIERVTRLVVVDPSSACQRLFNAAMHDLREKVVIAGIDIAKEAAAQHKLPTISREEDVQNYSTSKLIDLAYRMGLLNRPEWRRVCRSYEIRRDLEHEDDEYEAGAEDCVYIFTTCIDIILAVDPIQLLKVTDVKTVVEQATPATPSEELLEDFERAPQPRQVEIMRFLVSNALDKSQSDIIQQNAYNFLSFCKNRAHPNVIVDQAKDLQNKAGRQGLDRRLARVATAAGAMPYMRQSARKDLFEEYSSKLDSAGTDWSGHEQHGELLREFQELGGFASCPNPPKEKILLWMVLTHIGKPGGQTRFGNVRHVYYSNTAAPLIEDIFKKEARVINDLLPNIHEDEQVKLKCKNQYVARRLESLLDLCGNS